MLVSQTSKVHCLESFTITPMQNNHTKSGNANPGNLEQLSGAVERVTFHNEDSGFCVLRVKVKGHQDLITVTGNAASVSPGEYVDCQGSWINDRTYGLQFKAVRLVRGGS